MAVWDQRGDTGMEIKGVERRGATQSGGPALLEETPGVHMWPWGIVFDIFSSSSSSERKLRQKGEQRPSGFLLSSPALTSKAY